MPAAPLITPDGVFTGYASLFNSVDLGRDLIEPGAFMRSLLRRGPGGIKCLYQHDPKEPIGVWLALNEDQKGLRVTGRLIPDVARAREVFALVRASALDGLSIGFRAAQATRDARSGVRRLKTIDLWEVSIVTFPMLPEARIAPQADGSSAPGAPWRAPLRSDARREVSRR